ncbi:hypothetical protein FRC19_008417 [Serendipita sp. 401]|nr:hypothetical protein FRC19_008417 [Serendipita sp. 401]KAG9058793.1 hypothetical protein FS842_003582 [Serendipita sp. 407]
MSSTSSNPLSSILRTLAAVPPSRDRQQAARQLARLDPKQFLANLQTAATSRSPHAISALKTDMRELEDIFDMLSRAGHDASSAQRDFRMLQHFVSQLASSEKRHPPPFPLSHHRASSLPNTLPPSQEHFRSRSGAYKEAEGRHSTRHYHDTRHSISSSAQAGFTPRSTSSSSTTSSRTSSYSGSSKASSSSSSPPVLSPIPNRLTKPRRMSAPDGVPSAKKVHFATHATIYSYRSESAAVVPPSRPACLPRAEGSSDAHRRPRF